MSETKEQSRLYKNYSPYLLPTPSWWRKFLCWGSVTIFVVFTYVAVAFAIYKLHNEPDRLAGEPPTLMLEFAPEATAPNNYFVAKQLQAETQANTPDSKEDLKEETEPPIVEPIVEPVVDEVQSDPIITPPADVAEDIKKEEPKKAPKKEPKKVLKNEPKKQQQKSTPKRDTPSLKKQVQKGNRNQQAAAPLAYGKVDKTFAAPRTTQTDGLNGKLHNDWKGKVEVKLRAISSRFNRSTSGLNGIVSIEFFYDVSGKITLARVSRSSGNEQIDNIGLKVVRTSSPLPPPPNGAGKLNVPISVR